MSLQLGAFVTVEGINKGLAKVTALQNDDAGAPTAEVEWFTSVAQHTSKPLRKQVPLADLEGVSPPPQTRCYLEMPDGTWDVGRVTGEIMFGGEFGKAEPQVPVKVAGQPEQWFDQSQVWVRCLLPGASPLQTLAAGAQDTPFFHPRRHAFLSAYLRQRGAAGGLTGLLSARVKLLRHQVHVVRRVLKDPICRYLLADEVGLGKTIEAGVIARQLRIDFPNLRILIAVPSALVTQWKRELEDKFALAVDGDTLTLISHDELALSSWEQEKFGLVIFDEAHHIGAAHRDPDRADLWEKCRDLAHTTPRLLLLSATPALGHEADFAAMLHLLEPQLYRLDDLDAFKRRVQDRQEIGRFLNGFSVPLPRVAARYALPELRALFSDDDTIMEGARALEELIEQSKEVSSPWKQAQADEIARRLRVQISESYRLHRRLVRTSRATLERDGMLAHIEVGKRLGATAEWDFDSRLEPLHDALESWREAAYRSFCQREPSDNESETASSVSPLVEVYAVLWTMAATWSHLLRLAIECRLAEGANEANSYADALGEAERAILRTPRFEGEEEALQALLEALEHSPTTENGTAAHESDALEVAVAAIAQEWEKARDRKVVVFASSPLAASTLARRLRTLGYGGALVGAHLQESSGAERASALRAFEAHDGPAALVCDRSGEEGLNLQFAHALLMLDVPVDPNRLEQRLGRLDRIGSARDLRPRVLAGWSGERASGSLDHSIHDAWFKVLDEGLRVFDGSIADLGYAVEAILPRLKSIAFELGPQGLLEQIETVKASVKAERVKIREQAELDETESFGRDDDAFFEALVAGDRDGLALRAGVDAWLYEAWSFRPDLNFERPLWRAVTTEKTLAPRDWRARLLAAQNAAPASWPRPFGGCYERAVACERPHVQLLRPGHALLDELYALSLWDDRGQAFAFWRSTAQWSREAPELFFRFDLLIEADMEPLQQTLKFLKASGWKSSALAAFKRQAESWLPPQWKSYLLDRTGRQVRDPQTLECLAPEYEKTGAGRDYNLDAQRLWALDAILSTEQRKTLCRDLGAHVLKVMRNNPTLQATWNAKAEIARHEGERRLELVRRGLLRGADFNAKSAAQTAQTIEEQLAQELLLSESLCAGLAQPSIRIDAAGLIVLSRNNPFANEAQGDRYD